jgi:hypothetical protein
VATSPQALRLAPRRSSSLLPWRPGLTCRQQIRDYLLPLPLGDDRAWIGPLRGVRAVVDFPNTDRDRLVVAWRRALSPEGRDLGGTGRGVAFTLSKSAQGALCTS